jgi:hypothetical protein
MKAILVLLAAGLGTLMLVGCSDDSGSKGTPGTSGSETNNPSSLAGKTFNFTVEARNGLSEPVGSTFMIAFESGTYTFYPSPQNLERTNTFTAAYTYDAGAGSAVLEGAESLVATFHYTRPQSGTYHFIETVGESQDGTFTEQ